ncbi:Hint domain-containing protein [Halosimplex salinum]|uniref:Hint domain-containing protein n=1 Tax=Halosimplex salinum TaxID=1710538 RepID=UPI000F4A52BA|nr:Hint domain-containing protein [Halosimplex salinum]
MQHNSTGRDGDGASTTGGTGTIELAAGGFRPDTELITASGPTRISELSAGDRVYAFDLTTHLIKLKRVTSVQQVTYDGDLVALETNRCNLHVHPEHRIVCRTIGQDELRIRPAEALEDYENYKLANDWRTLPGERLEEVDITDFVDDYEMCAETDVHGHTVRARLPEGCEPVRRNGHVGYCFDPETFEAHQEAIESIAAEVFIHAGPNHHRRPYRFDGDDFVEFLGWFVTEGSTTWPTSSDTIQIQIAQQDEEHRPAIRDLFDRMGFAGHTDSKSFSFSSKVFGRLLESLCGTGSHEKHLPAFVWDLSTNQQELLYETLLAGDGSECGTYYTASDRLAAQLCRLLVELGLKPKWTNRRGTWRVCGRDVNDGFMSSQNVRRVDSSGTLYRLTMKDYSSVLAGRTGIFQWVGVSRVS